jgi:hypothetical protein
MNDASLLASVITAAAAIAGIMVTAVISLSQRGDALRNVERTALHEASRQLTSTKDADRALAVEVAVAYAIRSRVEVSAQQTLLGAMHYEDSPFVVYRH